MARKRQTRGKSSALTTSIAFIIIALIAFVNFYGGKLNVSNIWEWLGSPAGPSAVHRTATVPIPKPPGAIRIGTFNIQVFGASKLGKPEVMGVLADVVRQFDLIAIQEIRTQDDRHIDKFLSMINTGGRHYEAIVGPRLGRTSSKEQYAYLYDAETIELIPGSDYTIEDRKDLLHREPFIASFRVRGPPPGEAFSFRLIDIHTDPDETKQELDALGDVFSIVQQQSREDDIILLGDLNVDVNHFGRLGYLPGVTPVIRSQFTNTRGTKMLDNIVFDGRRTVEYLREGGVMDLPEMYGLSQAEALEVSDHLPVWADFSQRENGTTALASDPDRGRN